MIGDPYAKVGLVGVLLIGMFGLGVAVDRLGGGRLVREGAREGALTPEIPLELSTLREDRREKHTALVALSVPRLAAIDEGSVQVSTPGYSLDGAQVHPVYEYRKEENPKPRSIFLLMDNSQSMVIYANGKSPSDPDYRRLDAGRSLMESLNPKDRVSFACFPCRRSELNQVNQPFPLPRPFELLVRSETPTAVAAKIDELRAEENGGTPLYSGIAQSASLLAENPEDEKRILVVLTDGEDSGKRPEDLERALSALSAAKAEVFAVGLGGGADMNVLRQLAPLPGHALRADDAATLSRTFRQIQLQMSRAVVQVDLDVMVARNGRPIPPGQPVEITFRSRGKLYRTQGKTK